jgi:pSer/pThr/pTyr-binding forkhead associated (FHA) protein
VRDGARESNYHFVGPVEVNLIADPGAGVGDLDVEATILEGPAGAAGALVLPDGSRIELGDDPVRIGRLPDCTIALSDSQASRHHAEVRRSEHGYEVVDLNSLNGTTVNGTRVQEHTLADGDVISVGETAIHYEES